VQRELAERGEAEVVPVGSADADLTDAAATRELFERVRPTAVIHLAAKVGGIGANLATPGTFFRDNMLMGVHVLDEARRAGVDKLLLVGTTCSYPKFAPVPLREEALWNGFPEETNAAYGVAKRALLTMAEAYRREFGCHFVSLLPTNLYGPRDNFDMTSSHVIPAMIRKFDQARREGATAVSLWGDGTPTRDFLFAADAAEAIVLTLARYDEAAPMKVGSGVEVSICELAGVIAREIGFEGCVDWDRTRPNGQPRRRLDVARVASEVGFVARTSLEEGLRATITWWRRRLGVQSG
jgi:GDP-L-fucose synthase